VIVVHGWWSLPSTPGDGGALVLWAEDGSAPIDLVRRPGRRPKVRDHPFAVEADQLAKVLGLPVEDWSGEQPSFATADLVLPSFSHLPSASPELLDLRSMTQQTAGEGETLRLRPDVRWRVPAVVLAPHLARPILVALGDDEFTAGDIGGEGADPELIGIRVGSDLRQLIQLLAFAVDLVSRGRVLPVALPGASVVTGLPGAVTRVTMDAPPGSASRLTSGAGTAPRLTSGAGTAPRLASGGGTGIRVTSGAGAAPTGSAGTTGAAPTGSAGTTGATPTGAVPTAAAGTTGAPGAPPTGAASTGALPTGAASTAADPAAAASTASALTAAAGTSAAARKSGTPTRTHARATPETPENPPPGGVARWRPLLTGTDADWFRAAVIALPPSYRAGFDPDTETDPSLPIGRSLAAALDSLVDVVVRDRIGVPDSRSRPTGTQTGTAAWRRALRGPDPTFEVTGPQLVELAGSLAAWQAEAIGGGAVRACFRLVEPTEDDETGSLQRADRPSRSAGENSQWRIEFGLQVVDEPSVLVMAERIWQPGARPRALARHTAQPQEKLLAELGRALRLYPMLGVALAGPRPSELVVDTQTAHAFLAETAPLLIGAGFGVQLPGWWSNPRSRLGARLRAGTPTQPGRVEGTPAFGQGEIVAFDWRLSVGDDLLTDKEVSNLIETAQPLVRLRGEWMTVDPERLRRARDFLRRKNSVPMTVGEVLRVLGSGDEGPGGLPVTGVEATGWLGDLLAPESDQRVQPVPAPDGFVGTLRPYQERGLAWLAFLESIGMGALLADDMGLGKTVQLLALIAHDLEAEIAASQRQERQPAQQPGPTLLVCPMSLVGNWQREAAKFTPHLRVHVQHGKERPQGKEFKAAVEQSDLVITTYALLARDSAALRKLPWRRVVLDEAQAVKNAATQAAIAARALKAPRRIAVTGTPVENRLADLWSLMEFANPKLLGDAAEFKRRFALPIERVGSKKAGAQLRALTQPFVLRRLKTDTSIISDLPEKLEMEVVCSLTAEQAALYQSVVTDMLARIADSSGIERRGLVLATMTKLKQVCNHPAQFLRDGSRIGGGRSGKLARLEETLDEVLAAGEKALLFTQYAEFGEMLRTHLTARFGREVIFLHGGVSKTARDEMVERFQQDDRRGPPLFVLSLKAGGTGLTLTAANHVVHVDRWWNPAVEDQATDRAFRIGQSRAVQVRKFICAGTLEEKISVMIADKRGLAASIVGTGEGWLTELSTSQLRELLTLDAGAVMS
jgi:non-specific serine/threonine protein kinase